MDQQHRASPLSADPRTAAIAPACGVPTEPPPAAKAALMIDCVRRLVGLRNYAGHSLRSRLATEAAIADVSERSFMAQTGCNSLPVVRRYIRKGSLFRRNAGGVSL